MGKFGKELIKSMRQAAAHAAGRKVPGMRVTTVALPDAKAIRRSRFELHIPVHAPGGLKRAEVAQVRDRPITSNRGLFRKS